MRKRRNRPGCLFAVLMAVLTAAATGVQIFGGVIDSGQQEGSVSGKAEVKSVGTLRFSDSALKTDPVTGQMYPNPLPDSAWEGFDILHKEQRGSLYTITARGSREELLARVNALNPTFCELLPLTLEEIFINETEVAGYDIKDFLY